MMAKQGDFSGGFSMEQAMAFAASPAGQQLIRMLQQGRGADFSKAQQYAAAGNMEGAKTELESLLKDPRVLAILKQFGN